MNKLHSAAIASTFVLSVLSVLLSAVTLTSVTHKSLGESVGVNHKKADVVKVSTAPTLSPAVVTVTATPSGTMHSNLRVVTPSVSPLPSHVILKK